MARALARCIALMAPTMNAHEMRKALRAARSATVATVQARVGAMKNQSAAAAHKTEAAIPGPRPPNQAAMATAGKKKINGRAVGPTTEVRASRASHPSNAAATATAY